MDVAFVAHNAHVPNLSEDQQKDCALKDKQVFYIF